MTSKLVLKETFSIPIVFNHSHLVTYTTYLNLQEQNYGSNLEIFRKRGTPHFVEAFVKIKTAISHLLFNISTQCFQVSSTLDGLFQMQ